jgi:putative sterol carrier protein
VKTGLQTREGLAGLELPEVADKLEARGLLARRARRVPTHLRLARRLGSALSAGRRRRDRDGGSAQSAPAMSREQLLQLLEEQRSRYGHPRVVQNFRGWNRAMQYHISDFDEYFLIRMVDGVAQAPESLSAPLERPEVSYQMDSQTLRAMTSGEISGAEAFRRRRLKLKASFSDIMKLQSLDKL